MNQKNSKLFALGHFIFPAMLLLLYLYNRQLVTLVLALLSVLFSLFLMRRAYTFGDLSH
ncbi:MAG: hypothetical protein K0Q59_5825, partial [Paenibacillus sp.]|nr:hypothetical protein [Paenibacillus sp.]